jgi:hypothetical protein
MAIFNTIKLLFIHQKSASGQIKNIQSRLHKTLPAKTKA